MVTKEVLRISTEKQLTVYLRQKNFMNTFKKSVVQDTINKALVVRGECGKTIKKLIILVICYANEEGTPMCMPDVCYHVFCRECTSHLKNKYILSKDSSILENVPYAVWSIEILLKTMYSIYNILTFRTIRECSWELSNQVKFLG